MALWSSRLEASEILKGQMQHIIKSEPEVFKKVVKGEGENENFSATV